jgi:ubiquinone/menaquinone biosynthesis C-methylase UbiE
LKGAIDLDLFTLIDNGAVTASQIAEKAQANARGVRILCDFLVVHGHLTKQNQEYGLTPTSKQFLSKNSRAYMGSLAGFLLHEEVAGALRDIAAVVRRGGPPRRSLIDEEPIWVEFARSMAPMAFMVSEKVADALESGGPLRSVLDIAESHGLYGITVARHNPDAQVTALDAANVLELARENAARAGISARHRLKPGNVFEADLGSGYDLVLLTNFLHAFERQTNEALLKRIRRSMVPGGRIAIMDMVPNEDRVSPPAAAEFALTMLDNTQGDTYTFTEYQEMLSSAGFRDARLESLAPLPQELVIAWALCLALVSGPLKTKNQSHFAWHGLPVQPSGLELP